MEKLLFSFVIFFICTSICNADDRNVVKSISKFSSYASNIYSVTQDDIDKMKTLVDDVKTEVSIREKERDAKPTFIAKAIECTLVSLQTLKAFEIQRHNERINGKSENISRQTSAQVQQGNKCLQELYSIL